MKCATYDENRDGMSEWRSAACARESEWNVPRVYYAFVNRLQSSPVHTIADGRGATAGACHDSIRRIHGPR